MLTPLIQGQLKSKTNTAQQDSHAWNNCSSQPSELRQSWPSCFYRTAVPCRSSPCHKAWEINTPFCICDTAIFQKFAMHGLSTEGINCRRDVLEISLACTPRPPRPPTPPPHTQTQQHPPNKAKTCDICAVYFWSEILGIHACVHFAQARVLGGEKVYAVVFPTLLVLHGNKTKTGRKSI